MVVTEPNRFADRVAEAFLVMVCSVATVRWISAAVAATAISTALLGCDRSSETLLEPDTTFYGYVTVWEIYHNPAHIGLTGRQPVITLKNANTEVMLLIGPDVELLNLTDDSGRPVWSFNDIHRADGLLNYFPPELADENGRVKITSVQGVEDWLWVTRIERLEELDEADARAVIDSGALFPD